MVRTSTFRKERILMIHKLLTFDIADRRNRQIFQAIIQGLIDLCDFIGDTSQMVMAEIGSDRGESAELFAQYFKKVFCIDPLIDPIEQEPSFRARIARFNNIVPVRLWSEQASQTFEDNSFDFIYIDADHSYEAVKKDIEWWLPKLRGKYIGGHDFHGGNLGVVRAVIERFGEPRIFQDNSWIKKVKE